MSYQYRIGRPCKEFAIGKEWTFAKFTRNVWAELAIEARKLMPDPIKVALPAVKEASLIDAEIIRELAIQDAAEVARAKAENRPPALLEKRYEPISKELTLQAYQASRRYLSAGSVEMSGFLMSHEGGSFLFWLLLAPNHPGVTIDDAYDVYWDLANNAIIDAGTGQLVGADGRKTTEEIIKVCSGSTPEPEKNEPCPV